MDPRPDSGLGNYGNAAVGNYVGVKPLHLGNYFGAHIAVIEPSATRAGIYVAMTRGRLGNFAWIPDPTGHIDPAQALAETIARPPNAATAHATRDRLYQQAGLSPPQSSATLDDPAERMLARLDALTTTQTAARSLGR